MKRKFSPALIKKCQKLILKKSGKKISKDSAELYLEKLSQLMLTTIKIQNYEKGNKKTNNSN
jgi:hypothetical protein